MGVLFEKRPLSCLLTPWSSDLLEKLTGLQLQEIPRISRNPKRPPPVSILGQLNSVHIPTSRLLEIHPNIIHPSTPRSPQWSPSLRFPHHDPIHPPLLTHTRHMPSPSHSSRLYIYIYIGVCVCVCVHLLVQIINNKQ